MKHQVHELEHFIRLIIYESFRMSGHLAIIDKKDVSTRLSLINLKRPTSTVISIKTNGSESKSCDDWSLHTVCSEFHRMAHNLSDEESWIASSSNCKVFSFGQLH